MIADPFAPRHEPAAAGAGAGGEDVLETLREYAHGLRRRWKLVGLVTLLGIAAGTVHFVVTPPIYQARTEIQIDRRSADSVISNQIPWLDYYFNMEFYPTQYRLLQSRGLAEQVVRDLRLLEEPRYAGGGDAEAAASSGEDRAALGKMAERLRSRLSVEPIRDTQLVAITYRSEDPDEAARIANGFARAFIDFSIRTRSETMSQTSDVLAEQIQRLKDEVVDLDEQLGAFSDNDQVLSFTPEGDISLERIEKLNDALMTAMRERIDKQARYQQLANLPQDAVIGSSALVDELRRDVAALEREYQTKLQTYKAEWPEMKELAGRTEQARAHLGEVVGDEARRVRQAAYAEYQSAQREEGALAEEIRQLKAQMSAENSQAVEFSSLQVELRTRRDMLDGLLRRQSETTFAQRLQTDKSSNVRIIDEALVPGRPTHPSLRGDLTGGMAGGLVLGLALGLLLQYADRTIKTTEEMERILRVPVLAVIPDLTANGRSYGYSYQYGYGAEDEAPAAPRGRRRDKVAAVDEEVAIELLPHQRPRLAVSEAYRSLRTALLLSSADELKVLAVTSVEASEGKTATATNLAVVLAQLGRRVLLIDGDLRKPRLHKVFGVSNRLGLVTYLTTGSGDEILHRTMVEGLFLVPSGPVPPNPSELLASDRMRELLARFRGSFDFVVIDTPPTLAVTDSTIVGSRADGVVLCVRSGRVDRRDAARALARLRLSEVHLLGAVLNAHRGTGGSAGYRYYQSPASPVEAESRSGSAA